MEDDENANTISKGDDIDAGGHLLERAAQFDIRTDRMNQGWYMQFSEHRKGSFLPRLLKHEGDNEWEEQRKNSARQKKGRPENGIWSNMPAKSARFLHWVGFDPNKGLPPPNEETTHALAFLGYDFVGRIVEKVSTDGVQPTQAFLEGKLSKLICCGPNTLTSGYFSKEFGQGERTGR